MGSQYERVYSLWQVRDAGRVQGVASGACIKTFHATMGQRASVEKGRVRYLQGPASSGSLPSARLSLTVFKTSPSHAPCWEPSIRNTAPGGHLPSQPNLYFDHPQSLVFTLVDGIQFSVCLFFIFLDRVSLCLSPRPASTLSCWNWKWGLATLDFVLHCSQTLHTQDYSLDSRDLGLFLMFLLLMLEWQILKEEYMPFL